MNARTRSHTVKRPLSEGLSLLVACGALALLTGCSALPPHPEIDEGVENFSARRARAHFAALAGLGPRSPGSETEGRARAYVERELEWAGAEVVGRADQAEEDPTARTRPVLAWIPGASPDRVLIVVPWSPGGERTGPDDAGIATLLELARALSRRPSPYTVGLAAAIVSSEGDAPDPGREAVRASGVALVAALDPEADWATLRAVLVVEPRADAPGQIARDLRSHPVFRDLFWRTAARLGHAATFPQEGGWSTPKGIQGAFLSAGYGRVLSLVDDSPSASPVSGQDTAAGLPDATAFEPVGTVAYEGLLRLMGRLARVDAFSPE